MVYEFKLPDIGEGVHEGEVSRWMVQTGQTLQEDQPMVEIMTDKVTVEITAPLSGTVQQILYTEGQVVKVGSVLIKIEPVNSAAVSKTAEAMVTPVPEISVAQNGGKSCEVPIKSENAPSMPMGTEHSAQKVLAAPAVRKLARAMGVNLALVSGSGPAGRIQKPDVLGYTSPDTLVAARKPVYDGPREERVAFVGMRRKIAEHLTRSKQTVPHFTYVEEGDMTALVALREDLDVVAQQEGLRLSYLPFIIKAVIAGLQQFPKLNSTLDEASQSIIVKHYYNIGIAVATPDGLVVPVIKDADQKSIFVLAAEIMTLSDKARKNKLSLSDLQGGTFTLTSIGSIGGIFSAPIINVPEVAIMGIQKIEKRPVVRNDQVVIREMTYFSISCDHRVVDGAEAALFMKTMIEHLEHPARLLL